MGYKDPVRQRIIDLISGDESSAETVVMPTPATGGATPADTEATSDTATSVTVMGLPASVEVGDSFTLAADVKGTTQGSLPGIPVEWSSTDPAIARVTGGHVKALKAGTAVITATAGEVTNSVSVLVAEAAAASVVVDPETSPLPLLGLAVFVAVWSLHRLVRRNG